MNTSKKLLTVDRECHLATHAISEFDAKICQMNTRIADAMPHFNAEQNNLMNEMFIALVNFRNAARKLQASLVVDESYAGQETGA